MPRSTPARVLYLGDGEPTGAAAYLLGIAHFKGLELHHVPSSQKLEPELWAEKWDLLILSDYPAERIETSIQEEIPRRVRAGMGLWMIGGWSSFRGQNGHWERQPLHELLPVEIASQDDRINCDRPAVAAVEQEHPILEGLPFDRRPPTVGGYNRVSLREGAELLLSVQDLGLLRSASGAWSLEPGTKAPLLAVIERGAGRCIAWMTDVAPHWVGGWVDWGKERVVAQHPVAREIEVGSDYVEFVGRLLEWGCLGSLSGPGD